MSINVSGSGNYIAATVPTLTVGTGGSLSMGCWVRMLSTPAGWSGIYGCVEAINSDTSRFVFTFNGSSVVLLLVGGNLTSSFTFEVGTLYWLVGSRDGGANLARVRIWNEAGSKLEDATTANTSALDQINVLAAGEIYGGEPAVVEMCNFKVQSGVAWSDAEAWAEANSWLIQKSGGTDRHAFRLAVLNDSTAGLHSCTSPALMTNSGCVAGASHPVPMERPPAASDDFNRANGDAGANWYRLPSSANPTIYTNALGGHADYGSAAGVMWIGSLLYTLGRDQWTEIILQSGTNRAVGPLVRAPSYNAGATQGAFYDWALDLGASSDGQVRCQAGSVGDRAGGSWATGDVARIEAIGRKPTTVRVYRNGVQVGSDISDNNTLAQTGYRPGASVDYNTGVIDAWACGGFGPLADYTRSPYRDLEEDRATVNHHTASRLDAPRFPGG